MPFIPFTWNPKHWGLEGEEREIAEAHYKLRGEALEYRLLEIEHSNRKTKEEIKDYKLEKLDLDLKYGKVSDDEYHEARISLMFKKNSQEYKQAHLEVKLENNEIDHYEFDTELLKTLHKDHESPEYLIALADIDLTYEEISEIEHEKRVADAKKEPWVKVIKAELIEDKDTGTSNMSFELDWNTYFVEDLMLKGWTGLSGEQIVDQWFTHMCQNSMNPDEFFDTEEGTL